jgi:hypothetical protein
LNETIRVTGEHPFYVKDESWPKGFRWTRVKELQIGDDLMEKDGSLSPVKSLERVDEPINIYNLTVEGEHNYFAGGFLVHNKGWYGNNSYANTRAADMRNAQMAFNEDTSTEWVSALNSMYTMGKDASDSLGVAQEMNEAGEITQPATGDYKTLLDAIDESRKSFKDEMKGVQETNEEHQSAIRDAMEQSNMVTSTERMEMDAQKDVAEAAEEAKEVKDQASIKANADFQAAVDEKTAELSTNMGAELDVAITTNKDKNTDVESNFDTLKGYKWRFKKNLTGHVRSEGGHGDTVGDGPPLADITSPLGSLPPGDISGGSRQEGKAIYKNNSGPMTNSSNIEGALDILSGMNKSSGVDTSATVGDSTIISKMAEAVQTHPDSSSATVTEVWSGASATTPGNDGAARVIKNKCFAGNTWIEVVK